MPSNYLAALATVELEHSLETARASIASRQGALAVNEPWSAVAQWVAELERWVVELLAELNERNVTEFEGSFK